MPLCSLVRTETVAPAATVREVVFIDRGLADVQTLAQAIQPGAALHLLPSDALAHMTDVLAQYSHLQAVHVLAHGRPGCLYLGDIELSLATLGQYRDHLARWFAHYHPEAKPQLLLYGCNLAAGDGGQAYLEQLGQLTQAAIAASTQRLGRGNWTLDWSRGGASTRDQAHPRLPLASAELAAYAHTLNAAPTDLSFGIESKAKTITYSFDRGFNQQGYQNPVAFAALKDDGSVVTWGDAALGGNSSAVASQLSGGVDRIFSNFNAFAALKTDGSVVTWGNGDNGGNSSTVASQLSGGVREITGNLLAFAALKDNGSVVTWGNPNYGSDSSALASQLSGGVRKVFANLDAFAALKQDGSVVTWGNSNNGGNSSAVAAQLRSGVREVFATEFAFAALKDDGSVVTWGDSENGGNTSAVSARLASNVVEVVANSEAFAALKGDGSVVTWGDVGFGGGSSIFTPENDDEVPPTPSSNVDIRNQLASGVTRLVAGGHAFAALKANGSVVTWGLSFWGGSSAAVAAQLSSGVVELFSTGQAFAALKADGSVVTWGGAGGDSSAVSGQLSGGVVKVFANTAAFAALKADGSVVTWGEAQDGGDSSAVAAQLGSGVVEVFATRDAFAALKADGSVITWGQAADGGNSSAVAAQLGGGVVGLSSLARPASFAEVNAIDENSPANSLLGRFRTTDPDSGDSFTYALVEGEGDRDNGVFTLAGSDLRLNQVPNFESQASYSIRVRTTDQDGASYEEIVTLAVNDLNDTAVGQPAVVGSGKVAVPLGVDLTGLSDEDGLPTTGFSYQWQRRSGQIWTNIGGATAASFTPTAAQLGAPLRVRVSYTDNGGGIEQVFSAPSPVITENQLPAGRPTVLPPGSDATEDSALTANLTGLVDADGLPNDGFGYQWQQSSNGTTWRDIADATAASFTPGDAQVGEQLRLAVSYTDGGGTVEQVVSPATNAVVNVNDLPEGAVAIAGLLRTNQRLRASNSLSDVDGLGPIAYQWQQGGPGNWSDIAGATGDRFTPRSGQIGQVLRVVARYTDGQGSEEMIPSPATEAVLPQGTTALAWDTVGGEISRLGLDPATLSVTLTPINRRITDTAWALQTTGDLNGDGQDDVLLRQFGAGQNLAFYLSADGSRIESEALIGRLVPDPAWSLAGTGDIDDDGNVDIILRNQGADQIVAWYMDGQGGIREESLIGRGFGDNNWKIVAVTDFNGDGKADLLLQQQGAGQILLWEMDGPQILNESLVGRPIDSNWYVEGARDIDGNGTTDILLRQRAAGQSLLWSMASPTAIAAEVLVPGLPGGTSQLLF